MIARMRQTGWRTAVTALTLSLLVLTGCRSSSGSRDGSCGGGCCRGNSPEAAGVGVLVPADKAAAAAEKSHGGQKACPVMGEELGSMGPAVPVTVKGETIYVCCLGCAGKVQRDPDKYVPKVLAERAGQ